MVLKAYVCTTLSTALCMDVVFPLLSIVGLPTTAKQKAKRVSDKIDEGIKLERERKEAMKKNMKVLLLGQSKSGKSTLRKSWFFSFVQSHFLSMLSLGCLNQSDRPLSPLRAKGLGSRTNSLAPSCPAQPHPLYTSYPRCPSS